MKSYEITYLVADEKKGKEFIDIFKKNNVDIQITKEWGKRGLAYEIGAHKSAYYYTATFTLEKPSVLQELKKKLNFAEVAIRYLIINTEL